MSDRLFLLIEHVPVSSDKPACKLKRHLGRVLLEICLTSRHLTTCKYYASDTTGIQPLSSTGKSIMWPNKLSNVDFLSGKKQSNVPNVKNPIKVT